LASELEHFGSTVLCKWQITRKSFIVRAYLFFIFYFFIWRKQVSDAVVYVNDNDFNALVLESELPVLLDYWAEWCGPCKMIAPLLDTIANEFSGKLTVAKMNIDESPNTPQKYGVRGIPTLMFFKAGEVEGTKVGALTKIQLVEFINTHL
jgi:thioredoxin 1